MHFECSTIFIAYTQFVLTRNVVHFQVTISLARKHKSCWQHSPETNQFDFDCSFYGLWHLITLFTSPLYTLQNSYSFLFLVTCGKPAPMWLNLEILLAKSPHVLILPTQLLCSIALDCSQPGWLAGWHVFLYVFHHVRRFIPRDKLVKLLANNSKETRKWKLCGSCSFYACFVPQTPPTKGVQKVRETEREREGDRAFCLNTLMSRKGRQCGQGGGRRDRVGWGSPRAA